MIIKEKERKLLIDVSSGKSLFETLQASKKLGDFSLQDGEAMEIQDAYLDNKEFVLAKSGGYLRFRGKTSGHLITIRSIKDVSIDEISHPVNDEGINLVRSFLAETYGISSNTQVIKPHFLEIFQGMGLNEVLRVSIKRVVRNIYLEDDIIGKMKIDEFDYLYPDKLSPFYEVEVNSYKKAFHNHVDKFISKLLEEHKNDMEVSVLSKYLRGINIAYGFNLK